MNDDDSEAVTVLRPGLRPFRVGDGRAAEAGRRSGQAKRARRATSVTTVGAAAAQLDQVRATFGRDQLGPDAAAVAGYLLGRVASGDIPIRNGDEAATLLRALVDVARLEAGEATSTAIVAHVGRDAASGVLALRDQARAALGPSAAAGTADDEAGSPVLDVEPVEQVHADPVPLEQGSGGVPGGGGEFPDLAGGRRGDPR